MNDAKSSTATATTATAKQPLAPVGRFAPSPTGPLHLGSLVAATGSYLDARHGGGRWLLRIEDLDTARNLPGAEATIRATLQSFGFRPDGAVLRQSERLPRYLTAIRILAEAGRVFHCGCSRRDIAAATATAAGAGAGARAGDEPRCVGRCRERRIDPAQAALRASLEGLAPRCVQDRSGREIRFDPEVQTDVVIRRRDGVIAYQLAVIVDDAEQGISDVVRGGDLLPSTAWQLALQQALSLPTPRYLHLPVITEPDGSKLAKSRRSLPLDPATATDSLCRALTLLNQPLPPASRQATLEALWDWAIAHWDPAAATARSTVSA
ncbi:MAG: tRNA glutamyl-Q(34) synthetase GluQRS [Steroidobacteraceae bacterium]|nr:tRNA glutamyl-Q(34) synthetase GluQRS [Nevskiaceae bacterium]MCP5340442.1 tRNA glutamyl-Q(34) synthetase GluQRS [Nevskiaceae bacterium]MCP5359917.1 tRNA glutamyl-Q(34) synthetase GluQRS [Nevskiaceae bacterium]